MAKAPNSIDATDGTVVDEAATDEVAATVDVAAAGVLPEGAPADLVAPFVLNGELYTGLTRSEIERRWPHEAAAILAEAVPANGQD